MDQVFNWGSVDPFLLLPYAFSNSNRKERVKDIMAAVKQLQRGKAEKTKALEQLLDMATTFYIVPIYHYPVRFPKTSGKKKTGVGPATKVKRRDITISSTSQESSTSNLRHSSRQSERAINTSKRAINTELIPEDIMSAVTRLQGGEAKKSEAIGQPMDIPTTQEPSTSTQRRSSGVNKGDKYKQLLSEGLLDSFTFKESKRPAQSKPKGQGAKSPKAE